MFKRLLTSSTVALSAVLLIGSSANADVLNQRDTNNGTLQTITDFTSPDAANPNFATSIPRTINVVENEVIQDISVTIEGLQHTFAGDLVASLSRVDENGVVTQSIPLFERIQLANDLSPDAIGDSSDFDGNYTFRSAVASDLAGPSLASIWSVADSIATDQAITPSLDGQLTASTFEETLEGSYFATDENENPLSFADSFAGQSTFGQWVFRIQDSRNRNVGSFTGVTLNFQSTAVAVPEPGSVGLMAVGAVGGFFYLRRRKKNEEETAEKAA